MLTMNKSKLARNAATDTTRTVDVERVVDDCVVTATFASQSSSLTGRPGQGRPPIAEYRQLYLEGTAAGEWGLGRSPTPPGAGAR
jgi:hypothetical protein